MSAEKTATTEPAISYVVQTAEGGWRIVGTRVSLDSVVYSYQSGLTPEAIVHEFPTLSLESVHGAIAFYLHNRETIDRYLRDQAARWEQLRDQSESKNRELLAKLRSQKTTSKQSEPG
jgi:uncharacterized protein (DUF433 family)